MSLRATLPPVLPLQFIDLVPSPGESICSIFTKFFKFAMLEYAMWKYKYGTNGEFTEAFATEICLALESCKDVGDVTQPIYIDDPVYGGDYRVTI